MRQISQQTFDDAVRENVEEFGMAPAEAARDAVQQFEAQGVDLANILKLGGGGRSGADTDDDANAAEADGADAEPAKVLAQLQSAIAELRALSPGLAAGGGGGDVASTAVATQLTELQTLCGRFPEAKVVAGRHDAVDALLGVMTGASAGAAAAAADERLSPSLGAALEQASELLALLCAASPDNQDFVGRAGMQQLADALARLTSAAAADAPSSSQDSTLVSSGMPQTLLLPTAQLVRVLQAVRAACAKHEANKAHFAQARGVDAVRALLPAARQSDALSKHVALVLRSLTASDDPRAVFSQAPDTVKALVAQDTVAFAVEAVRSRVTSASSSSPSTELLALWLVVLRQLAVTEESCRQIAELRGLELLQQAMAQYARDAAVVRRCITVLRNVAAADELKARLVASGGVERVLAGMQLHAGDAALQQHACATLAAVALRAPLLCTRVVELGGARQIARAMRAHGADAALLRQASLALRNLVARCAELRPRVLAEGVEPLLRDAQRLRGCGDEAYAALRDLGCDIRLAAVGGAATAPARFNPVNVASKELLASVADAAEAPFAR